MKLFGSIARLCGLILLKATKIGQRQAKLKASRSTPHIQYASIVNNRPKQLRRTELIQTNSEKPSRDDSSLPIWEDRITLDYKLRSQKTKKI